MDFGIRRNDGNRTRFAIDSFRWLAAEELFSGRNMDSRKVGSMLAQFAKFRIEDTNQSVAQRFEQRVRRYPSRLAVKANQQKLTYDELNRAANQVAHAILRRDDPETTPLALLCGTALSTIIASLGALKAGRVFAPVDPRWPQTAAKQVLERLDPPLILSDEKSFKQARRLAGLSHKLIVIDDLAHSSEVGNPRVKVSPDALAYLSFTSGSTGPPKGVMWTHRSELFGIRTKTNALRVAPSDRITLLRANSVGAARDMFLALLNGAALLTFDLNESNLSSLAQWLRDEEVTIFSCVATVFRHALRGLSDGDRFPAVRLVHIGGEPLFRADVESYKRHFSNDCLFINRYSISETQAVSYYFIDKHTEITGDRVPVGYPLEGNEVFILDDAGRAVEPGAAGAIAVRSAYLAAGYWREPELTRAKFLADPTPGDHRTYLTGDLGYRNPDGCLVHLGREDFQTKIRGRRVETSAIETALQAIPSVKDALVAVRKDSSGSDSLIAYMVPRTKGAGGVAEWRSRLRASLPDYMVPSAFVVLDRMPINAGGKIDRRALPKVLEGRPVLAGPFVAARSAVEKVLARFWSDTLGIETPGVRDDFYDRGGDSLKAARIAARIQELFLFDRSSITVAQAPTIEELATLIVDRETESGRSEKIAEAFLIVESLSDAEVAAALEARSGS